MTPALTKALEELRESHANEPKRTLAERVNGILRASRAVLDAWEASTPVMGTCAGNDAPHSRDDCFIVSKPTWRPLPKEKTDGK